MNRILVTGGAGFIGSHLARELVETGHHVRILDAFDPQVHGLNRGSSPDLPPDVELVQGDVRDGDLLREALDGRDAVVHLAASVGVGQSMYEFARYVANNALGTAMLLEHVAASPVERLVVASSMSVYGEGLYRDASGALVEPAGRTPAVLEAGAWEPRGPDGRALEPVPTPESKRPDLASVYALTKYDQERLCLLFGAANDVPTVALRYFNVYGTGQSLSNPYTGMLAIFASRILSGRSPVVFEDGEQRRDLVHVEDAARATRLALEAPAQDLAGEVLNVASGESVTVLEVANAVAEALERPDLTPEVPGKGRVGDVRHCFASVERARDRIGYAPRISFRKGLERYASELLEVGVGRPVRESGFDRHKADLEERGLLR